jgi:hypothetical protein
MIKIKILVCGTQNPSKYGIICNKVMNELLEIQSQMGFDFEIIEGECVNSADIPARLYGEMHQIYVHKYPATPGTHLKRNIEMVEFCDKVIAFWDGWSYGTAHAIANAVMRNKLIKVIKI